MEDAGILIADTERELALRVRVRNRSSISTGEVVQIYVKNLDCAYAEPNGKLCAFSRIFLEGGESRTLEMKMGKEAFTVINQEGERVMDGCRFQISAGLGQPDARTRELTGREGIVFRMDRK